MWRHLSVAMGPLFRKERGLELFRKRPRPPPFGDTDAVTPGGASVS